MNKWEKKIWCKYTMEYYSVLKNEGNSGICNERNGIIDHNVK